MIVHPAPEGVWKDSIFEICSSASDFRYTRPEHGFSSRAKASEPSPRNCNSPRSQRNSCTGTSVTTSREETTVRVVCLMRPPQMVPGEWVQRTVARAATTHHVTMVMQGLASLPWI